MGRRSFGLFEDVLCSARGDARIAVCIEVLQGRARPRAWGTLFGSFLHFDSLPLLILLR